jgi:LuxR family maltose regulon positive regulatory protein
LIYFKGDAKNALKNLQKAKSLIPESHSLIKAEIELYLSMAKQMTGDGESAIKLLEEDISTLDKNEKIMQTRLSGALIFLNLLCGDLEPASIAAEKLILFSEQNKLSYANVFAHYALANANLHSFDLERSLKEFSLAFEKSEIVNAKIAVDIASGLILTYLILGRLDKAVKPLKKLQEYVGLIGEPALIDVAESCNARFLLLQGNSKKAIKWARSFKTEHHAPSMNFWLEIPHITQARVLITAGSNEDINIALESLTALTPQILKLHNNYQYIEILVLKSLALEKLGREDEALTVLEEVVLLSKPGGWIRPFIEAGKDIMIMLEKLIEKDTHTDYCKMLIEKYESYKEGLSNSVPSSKAGDNSLDESLTERETEILSLLSKGLKNREIAEKIFLSPTTIKKHIYNIYQKLDVHSRIEVVTKARENGIIS